MKDISLYYLDSGVLPEFGRYNLQSRSKAVHNLEVSKERAGMSFIYGFPFRLYAEGWLGSIIGTWENSRIRVHTPISVNHPDGHNAAPISVDVPFTQWPEFEWSSKINTDNRHDPPFNLELKQSNSAKTYNALRIDFWGPEPEKEVGRFLNLFLDWLRFLTGQSWIKSYDSHHDSSLKFMFSIDESGRAIEQPIANLESTVVYYKIITGEVWQKAFIQTIHKHEVPIYWGIYLDAHNSYARKNLWECVLYMTLSIEVARNIEFQRIWSYSYRKGKIVFAPPLEGTNLLELLSGHLDKAIGRNLERENFSLWSKFNRLYLTRHLIAHGKLDHYQSGSGLKQLHDEIVSEWLKAVPDIIKWIEKLPTKSN